MQASFALGSVPWEGPGGSLGGPLDGERKRERGGVSNWQLFHSRS